MSGSGAHGVAVMRDFMRDWRRWTPRERLSAAMLAMLAVAMPALLAIASHTS
jgi:hypothetical protein